MTNDKFQIRDKTLVFLAYILWIPSLYIVLTEKRKEEFVGYHGGEALVLWLKIFLAFFAVRFLVNFIWGFYYLPGLELLEVVAAMGLWGYAVYCGWRCYQT